MSDYTVTCPVKGANPSHVGGQPIRALVFYDRPMIDRPDLSEEFKLSLIPYRAAYAITENAGRTFDVWYIAQHDEESDWGFAGSWSQDNPDYFRALFRMLAAIEGDMR